MESHPHEKDGHGRDGEPGREAAFPLPAGTDRVQQAEHFLLPAQVVDTGSIPVDGLEQAVFFGCVQMVGQPFLNGRIRRGEGILRVVQYFILHSRKI